jgi:hypothetical protein
MLDAIFIIRRDYGVPSADPSQIDKHSQPTYRRAADSWCIRAKLGICESFNSRGPLAYCSTFTMMIQGRRMDCRMGLYIPGRIITTTIYIFANS